MRHRSPYPSRKLKWLFLECLIETALISPLKTSGRWMFSLRIVARRFETSFVEAVRKRQLLTQAVVRVMVLL
ncbi:MAG: hypothetical protein CBD18_02980 [Opitutales bacterium TMED158]|nr:MAG: hypothetical protein CBD18_02980 [Opitutales bacterium TMED158]